MHPLLCTALLMGVLGKGEEAFLDGTSSNIINAQDMASGFVVCLGDIACEDQTRSTSFLAL